MATLAGGRSELLERIGVSTGVEVRSRSDGQLSLTADWNLASGTAQLGEPLTLTLRSAGNLLLGYTLSDGFNGLSASSALLGGSAASYRLVGGADFSAANPMATRSDGSSGDVVIGRAASSNGSAPPVVLLRTTVGDIEIAAGRDIRTTTDTLRADGSVDRRSQVRIYTSGTEVDAASLPGFERSGISRGKQQFLRNGTTTVGPYFENAGDISLSAGRDILGTPAKDYTSSSEISVQYVNDWWYRESTAASATSADVVAFWSRYDRFAQGLASFGGGDIKVSAGRDLVDLDASTPFTGYRVGAAPDGSVGAQERWFAGGKLDASAGRDVVGGLFDAGGASARLVAGGSLAGRANPLQPAGYAFTQLFYGDTAWTIAAAGDLRIGTPTLPALMSGAKQGGEVAPRTGLVRNLAGHASATLLSLSGDVEISSSRPPSAVNDTAAAATVPDIFSVAAPEGRVSANTLAQLPVGAAAFQLFARDGVQLEAVRLVAPVGDEVALPLPLAQATADDLFNANTREWSRSQGTLPQAGASARIVSLTGDVSLASTSFSAGALRLIAGRDLKIDGNLLMQHAAGDGQALSLLQAGRDIQMGVLSNVRVAGAGDLLAIAGRDIDFGRGQGIVSIGNQENDQQLPTGGAGITLLAGVSWSDYAQAVSRGAHLLGGGFENFPAPLAVQLEVLRRDGVLLDAAAMKAAAEAFDALPLAARQARVAALVGTDALASSSAAYLDQAVARAVGLSQAATEAAAAGALSGSNRLAETAPVPGGEFLAGEYVYPVAASAAERAALQAEVKLQLRDALQPRALGAALSDYVKGLDAATRQSLALAVSPYTSALRDFVARRTGSPVTSAADAAARFAVLPPEQQALFVNEVLTSELRAAGRLALTDRRVQYLRGYDAMDAVLAGARPAGRITLSNSQVKTAQGGDIRLFTPGGGINVGDLAGGGTAKAASDVGIVSVAGGEVDAVVRNSVEVNQSRVFTLDQGDVMLWARLGNLDAGRGAKTVVGAPPPLITINSNGQVVVDTSGSFSGSGIAVLNAASSLDLYAPMGEINAGEAGIKSVGNTFLGATRVLGADNLSLGGTVLGAPVKPPEAPTASLANAAQAAGAANARAADSADDEEARRRKKPRRNLFLDFLGFARGE